MNQKENTVWETVPMYCPNCGQFNLGYKDEEGRIKYQCSKCTMVMVRSYKNRRHDIIEVTIPNGMRRLHA